jgi:hypothetical protein
MSAVESRAVERHWGRLSAAEVAKPSACNVRTLGWSWPYIVGKKLRLWLRKGRTYCAFVRALLRQRERDHTDGQKQKHVKTTSNKMSFNSGVNLFFHFFVLRGLFFRARS